MSEDVAKWKPRKAFVWEKHFPWDSTEYAVTDLGVCSVWEIGGKAFFFVPVGMHAGTPAGKTIDDAKKAAEAYLVSHALNLIAPADA